MADLTALNMLKGNLGYYDSKIPPAVESHLVHLLQAAEEELLFMGINVKYSAAAAKGANLQAMYATWLFTHAKTGDPMPPMLVRAIRNWQVHNAI